VITIDEFPVTFCDSEYMRVESEGDRMEGGEDMKERKKRAGQRNGSEKREPKKKASRNPRKKSRKSKEIEGIDEGEHRC
jgi:hypothetical protein